MNFDVYEKITKLIEYEFDFNMPIHQLSGMPSSSAAWFREGKRRKDKNLENASFQNLVGKHKFWMKFVAELDLDEAGQKKRNEDLFRFSKKINELSFYKFIDDKNEILKK